MNKIIEDEPSIKAFDFGSKIKAKENLLSSNSISYSQELIRPLSLEKIKSEDNKSTTISHEFVKVKATNFTNDINKIFDQNKNEFIKVEENKVIQDDDNDILSRKIEVKNNNIENLKEKEDEYEGLTYSQIVDLEAKKYEKIYSEDLAKFDSMFLKQAISKIIINPELRKLALESQNLVKTFLDNIKISSYHISQFIKEDQRKLMEILHEYNIKEKNNKLVAQKIKDINILFFKLLEVNYFLRFKE
ncbi:MAG: hypothetical protein AABZ74_18020 [Cyanobacteriota bacterium]